MRGAASSATGAPPRTSSRSALFFAPFPPNCIPLPLKTLFDDLEVYVSVSVAMLVELAISLTVMKGLHSGPLNHQHFVLEEEQEERTVCQSRQMIPYQGCIDRTEDKIIR